MERRWDPVVGISGKKSVLSFRIVARREFEVPDWMVACVLDERVLGFASGPEDGMWIRSDVERTQGTRARREEV